MGEFSKGSGRNYFPQLEPLANAIGHLPAAHVDRGDPVQAKRERIGAAQRKRMARAERNRLLQERNDD